MQRIFRVCACVCVMEAYRPVSSCAWNLTRSILFWAIGSALVAVWHSALNLRRSLWRVFECFAWPTHSFLTQIGPKESQSFSCFSLEKVKTQIKSSSRSLTKKALVIASRRRAYEKLKGIHDITVCSLPTLKDCILLILSSLCCTDSTWLSKGML